MNKDLLQLLIFIESLKLNTSVGWKVPCINNPNDFFELELLFVDDQYSWRYRNLNTEDWINTSTISLTEVLEKNDVSLNNFFVQLREFCLSKVSYAYELVQQACRIFNEDVVYKSIEDNHDRLNEEIKKLLDGQDSYFLRLIKGNK